MTIKIPIQLPKEITDKYSVANNAFRLDEIKNPELDKIGEPKDEINTIIGDDKQPDEFYPQIKIQRWSNECNYSVRLIDNDIDIPQITTENNEIKFIKNKLEAHFYEKENAYEFEVLLKEKLTTNKIRFSLQDKDVVYYYQPPLTEEIVPKQIAKGWTATETDIKDENGKVINHRPENVVGSYAVYAKTPKTNWKDGKLYKTGKIGHIYRPKITDNAGNWTWGKLNISNGILTITIDQNWLDNAIYPVKIDPTFGYTTLGSSGANWSADTILSTYGNLGEDGIATSIEAGVYKETDNFNSQCGLYRKSDMSFVSPATAEVNISSATKQWITFDYSRGPSASSQDYYIACFMEGVASVNQHVAYDSISGDVAYESSLTYNTWPDPWDTANYGTNVKYSIYCNYTAGERTPVNVQKSLKYCIEKTYSNIQKSLQYSINLGYPNVTTQAVDSIEKTTAMGHGTIES